MPHVRPRAGRDKMVLLSRDEAEALCSLLEIHLFALIRDNSEIDNLKWLGLILDAYRKCEEEVTDAGKMGETASK